MITVRKIMQLIYPILRTNICLIYLYLKLFCKKNELEMQLKMIMSDLDKNNKHELLKATFKDKYSFLYIKKDMKALRIDIMLNLIK